MRVKDRVYWDIICGRKAPRKQKKAIIGTVLNKSKLRKRIHQYITTDMEGLEFCPSCGCHLIRSRYHDEVEYPEIWEEWFCVRCNEYLGGADNSAYKHILEDLKEEYNE